MYNIYDAFEEFKFNRIMNHDFLQVEECIKNFDIYENHVVMEGFLDDLLDFQPVTEGVKDVFKKIIDFIKEVWRKMKEWFKNVIGHFKKNKSVKEECEQKIKKANEKAADAPKADAPKADAPKKDTRTAREIYKEKSSKTRAARRECHSLEEVLHNSNLSIKSFELIDNGFRLSEYPPMVKELLDGIQEIVEDVFYDNGVTVAEFNEGLNKLVDGMPLGKRATRQSDKASESVPVNKHVDMIMDILNSKDDVIKALQQIEKQNDDYMKGFIKMCENSNMENNKEGECTAAIKRALNISTQMIKSMIGSIGRAFGACNAVAKKATAEYEASLAPYRE